MGIHKKKNMMSLGQALWKKGVKAGKWRQEKYFMGLSSLSAPCCHCHALGGKITFLELKIEKA